MYSSKPTMRPSTHVSVFSYIQICTRALVCKKRKIKFCRASRASARRVSRSVEDADDFDFDFDFPTLRAYAPPLSLSLSRARVDARAVDGSFERHARASPARSLARRARVLPRVSVASIRARARTYDRLRHDSLHFRRHGASFDASERSRDARGCFLWSLVVARAGSFASRDAH